MNAWKRALEAGATITVFCGTAIAAPIDWHPTFDITSVDDISTAGTLVEARNATIDGVSPVVFLATEAIEFIGQPMPSNNTSTAGFFTRQGGDTGDLDLNTVLDSHAFGFPPGIQFQLTELEPGLQYQIQIIAGGDRRGGLSELNQRVGDGENPENLSDDFTRGGVGSALGIFTADSTTQTINVVPGTGNPQASAMSGYILRVFEPPTAPSGILLSHDRIDPGTTTGIFIASLDAIDVNDPTGDTHSFELTNAIAFPDNANFTITNGNELRAANDLGEVGRDYEIQIRATDSTGLTLESEFTLTVRATPPITKIEHSQSMLRLTIAEVPGRRVGVAFTLDPANQWQDLGNFFVGPVAGTLFFSDPDSSRFTGQRGFYRAFLRPLTP